ncbi:MAG: hypothetical protein HPY76_13645 [Anaerolineae bacterium]|nr:hypothetical protein [Anaerolineae bacterium]
MNTSPRLTPVDYLVVGHVTRDVSNRGYNLGGTVSYAGLTASAIGMSVGIVTSCDPELPLDELGDIQRVVIPSEQTTTFRNEQRTTGRTQWLLQKAEPLKTNHIPDVWIKSRIVHLAPVANEVNASLVDRFKGNFLCITPQGWLRSTNESGRVMLSDWLEGSTILEAASATVIGIEDVDYDEKRIDDYAHHARILIVTEGVNGARLYWNGDMRKFRAPTKDEVDATGAGDIFASAFFIRLYQTNNPWEAARYATILASNSVTRSSLTAVPSAFEAQSALVEVMENA